MNLREWLEHGEDQLRAGPHSDRARRDAESLLLHLIGKNRAWLLAHQHDDFAGCKAIGYAALLNRRQKGEPIQYITGETEFYGLPFRVTPDVLIPRPETEHLVEKVLQLATQLAPAQPQTLGAPSLNRSLIQGWESNQLDPPATTPRILDIGTGSGVIAIALAHALSIQTPESLGSKKGTGFSPYIHSAQLTRALAPGGLFLQNAIPQITATDISSPALAIAKENATRNNVPIRFKQGDLLTPVAGELFEIIVSNPPYVPETDRPTLSVEVCDHEPALALFAGDTGLEIYRRLIPAAFAALAPGGYLALEIGFGQSHAVHTLLAAAGFQHIQFTPDLQGIPRVVTASRP